MALNNDISLKVGFDIERLTSELQKTNGLLTNWGAGIQRQLVNAFSMYASVYMLQRAVTSIVTTMAQFEHSMKAVEAISGATGEQLNKLRMNAINMAGAFDAKTIADFELEMARMGFTAEEVIKSTKAIIDLAAATGEDLVKSGEYAGATMMNFGLQASDMTRITDTMTGALNLSQMKLQDFGEAMKYVGPVANQAGISLEELSAWMVVLANNGVKSSMMGTSLRRIITDLGLQGKMTSEGLEQFSKSTLNVGQAYDEFGRIAQSVAIIMSHNGEKQKELVKTLQAMDGVTEKTAATMQDDMTGAANRLGASWDKLILKGGWLNTTLRAIIDYGAAVVNIFSGGTAMSKFEDALFAFNKYDNRFLRGTKEEIEKLQTAATEAGKRIGFVWDETGTKIRRAFAISNDPNMGPAQDDKKWFDVAFGKMPGPGGPPADKISHKNTDTQGMIYANLEKSLRGVTNAYRDVNAEMEKSSKATNENMMEAYGLDEEYNNFHEVVSPQVTAAIDNIVAHYDLVKSKTVDLKMSMQQMSRVIRQAYIGIAVDIGKALGDTFSGSGFNIEKILLGTLGRIMVQVGTMAIQIGIGLEGIRKALETLNPYMAIAAGVALVALGTYFSNESASIGSSFGGGGGGGGSFRLQPQAINITGQLTAHGSDLVLVLNKQGYNTGRAGG